VVVRGVGRGWKVMCCGDIRDNKRDNVG
jgi:hypothetical protein